MWSKFFPHFDHITDWTKHHTSIESKGLENNTVHKYIHLYIQNDICPNRSCNYFTGEEFQDNLNKNNYDLSLIRINIRSMEDLHFNEPISMFNCMEFGFDIIGLMKP